MPTGDNPNSRKNLMPPYGQQGHIAKGGKMQGVRDKLTKKLLKDLAEDYEQFGVDAIREFRENDPKGYVLALMSLLPKESTITMNGSAFDSLGDDQLSALATALPVIARAINDGAGGDTEGAWQAIREAEFVEVHQPSQH